MDGSEHLGALGTGRTSRDEVFPGDRVLLLPRITGAEVGQGLILHVLGKG